MKPSNKSINSKRSLNQININDGDVGERNHIELQDKKKKQKKTTSLQGRPAKASQELRKMEEEIKKVAWRNAELEECLYLMHGGASASHNETHQNSASDQIMETFKNKVAYDNFREMIKEWKTMMTQLLDPLGLEYVPLSDRSFLNRIIQKENEVKSGSIDILNILIIYAFQIFLRTDLNGFKLILKFLSFVYELCESDNRIGMNTTLLPDIIIPKIEKNFDVSEREKLSVVYRLLHVVMQESINHFTSKQEKTIRKSPNNVTSLI